MVSSLSALSFSTNTSPSAASSVATENLGVVQDQSLEEKIPLASKEEVGIRLASILAQVQQNQVKRLNLASASLGHFYGQVHTLSGHKRAVCSLTVLKNGVLASSSWDNTIKLWDLDSYSCFTILDGHTDWVQALAVLPSGLLTNGFADNTTKPWDVALNSCLSTLQRHTVETNTLAALPNGLIASGSWDTTIKLWDLASRSCLSTLQGHTDLVFVLAILPNNQLASGSWDTTIKLWDLSSCSCLFTLRGHTACVWSLTVLPNGQLASGSADTTIKLWDLSSCSCLFTLRGHTASVWSLTVLPNGQLASGSADTTIKLWDLTLRSCFFTLQEHTGTVFALTILPNGFLASGSADKTIKLWDLASHSCFSTLRGHTDTVFTLTALPNGLLVSGSADKTIKLWESRTLSAKHLRSILKALKKNTSVTDLDLSGNRGIFDDLIGPLTAIFIFDTSPESKANTSLKTIDLRRTGVSKKGIKKLEQVIQGHRLSIEVLADCPLEWMMIYFLIIFCRANRNSPFADSGLDLCKYGEIGSFLDVPFGFFARPRKNLFASEKIACLPNWIF